jgi:hypothetical protein
MRAAMIMKALEVVRLTEAVMMLLTSETTFTTRSLVVPSISFLRYSFIRDSSVCHRPRTVLPEKKYVFDWIDERDKDENNHRGERANRIGKRYLDAC